jgi:hypothetical protein
MQTDVLVSGASSRGRRRALAVVALLGILLGLLAPTHPATRAGTAIAEGESPTPPICSGNGSGCGAG